MKERQGYATAIGLVRNAGVAGVRTALVAFTVGFFILPLFRPSNLAPMLGFLFAPIGFVAGALGSLVWNLGRRTASPVARLGLGAAFLAGLWASLMSGPGLLARGMLLDLPWLPLALKSVLAPAGILRIWVVGAPAGKQQAYLSGLESYVGGPTLERHGYYTVRFVEAKEVSAALARRSGNGPDVVAFHPAGASAAPAWDGLIPVTGNFVYRGMAPFTWADPQGPRYGFARAIALGDLDCRALGRDGSKGSAEGPELSGFALRYATAVLNADAAALSSMTSSDAMRDRASDLVPSPTAATTVRVVTSRFCGAWGSEALAFAYLVVNHESDTSIGQSRFTLAVRREGGQWRVVAASRLDASRESLLRAAPMFDRAMGGRVREDGPLHAGEPSTPEQYRPARNASARTGHLIWRPSRSSDVVAEVVEVACRQPETAFGPDDRQLVLRPRSLGKPSPYFVRADAVCAEGWPVAWRVWSVTAERVAFSSARVLPVTGD